MTFRLFGQDARGPELTIKIDTRKIQAAHGSFHVWIIKRCEIRSKLQLKRVYGIKEKIVEHMGQKTTDHQYNVQSDEISITQ